MYLLDEMIEMAIREGESWASPDHRTVAVNSCIRNPRVKDAGTLRDNVVVINKIPMDQIRKVTMQDLADLGCHL